MCYGTDAPQAQTDIYDAHGDEQVEVWILNSDAGLTWLNNYRNDQDMHYDVERINVPMMYPATQAYSVCEVGEQYGNWEPVYMVIDKNGIIRDRGGYPWWEDVNALIETILNE